MSSAVLVLLCVACHLAASKAQRFTDKFDSVNLDEVLSNKRLVSSYVQCLTDRKHCSPQGAELKKVLPEVINTRCAECSDSQRAKALKLIRKVRKDYPVEWRTLLAKWDPTGQLVKEFELDVENRKQS